MTSRFGPRQRLRNRAGFDAVYANRRSRRVGPLLVFVRGFIFKRSQTWLESSQAGWQCGHPEPNSSLSP